jgi:hypothetical protein
MPTFPIADCAISAIARSSSWSIFSGGWGTGVGVADAEPLVAMVGSSEIREQDEMMNVVIATKTRKNRMNIELQGSFLAWAKQTLSISQASVSKRA